MNVEFSEPVITGFGPVPMAPSDAVLNATEVLTVDEFRDLVRAAVPALPDGDFISRERTLADRFSRIELDDDNALVEEIIDEVLEELGHLKWGSV